MLFNGIFNFMLSVSCSLSLFLSLSISVSGCRRRRNRGTVWKFGPCGLMSLIGGLSHELLLGSGFLFYAGRVRAEVKICWSQTDQTITHFKCRQWWIATPTTAANTLTLRHKNRSITQLKQYQSININQFKQFWSSNICSKHEKANKFSRNEQQCAEMGIN